MLGSSPADADASVTPAWVRFAALGDVERGFAHLGAETWCYVRRGPYAAFAIAGPGARPGVVLDQMDQALLATEEARARHDVPGPRTGEIPMSSSRPRTLLHPEPHLGEEPVVIDVPLNPFAFADPPRGLPPEPKDDLGFGPFPESFRTELEPPAEPDEPMSDASTVPATPAELDTSSVPDTPAQLMSGEEVEWAGDEAWASEDDAASERVQASETTDLELVGDGAPKADRQVEEPSEREPQTWEADDDWGTGNDAREASEADAGDDAVRPTPEQEDDVDRFSLAQEFGQLLQQGEDPADG